MGVANLDLIIKAWDTAFWEYTLAFGGLADENVWRRPHPRLLSIGEIAGHVAYYEAVRFTGPGPDLDPDLELVPTKSPLIDRRFTYYLKSIDEPVDLGLGAAEVLSEATRVHQAAREALMREERDSTGLIPGFKDATWGATLEYQIFHLAYHTGQMYSVRHMFGDTPEDN